MLGMFTFCDASEPLGKIGLAAAGIEPVATFKFNNSAMWSNRWGERLTHQYYDMGEKSFNDFVEYIRNRAAVPISLHSTHQILQKRQQM